MAQIYVYATDKFLSGWGCAEGKIHKQVAVRDSWEEANQMIAGFESDSSFKNVNYTDRKPYFNPSRYTATFRPAKQWTRFVKA